MVVGNEEKTVVFLLHFEEVPYRPEIIAQMKIACRPDPAYYCIHAFNLKFQPKGNKKLKAIKGGMRHTAYGVRHAACGMRRAAYGVRHVAKGSGQNFPGLAGLA
jgi:hypothetical protein